MAQSESSPEIAPPAANQPSDPDDSLGTGADAPGLGRYFAGYAVIFGGVIGFALLLGLLGKILR